MNFSNQPFSSQPIKKIKLSDTDSKSKFPQNHSEPSLKDYDSQNQSSFIFSPIQSEKNFIHEGKKKGTSWSRCEDELLKKAVEQHSGKNWKEISKMVPGRTSSQCSQRWRRVQPFKNRQPWTKEEDKLLADLTQKFGCNWSLISSIIEGRTGKQVRERYINKLDPKIDRTKFKEEEDAKIVKLYKELGPKWREISKSFDGRPENMIKNRFYSYIKKKYVNLGDLENKLKIESKEDDDGEEEEKEKISEESLPANKKTDEKKNLKKEMDEFQNKFNLLLTKIENGAKLDKNEKEKEIQNYKEKKAEFEGQVSLANLLLNKEKEISTEYTFNMGNLPHLETDKIENQFVNNLGTKFVLNSHEENELDFLFTKNLNKDLTGNFSEFEDLNAFKNEPQQQNLYKFQMEEADLQPENDKLERMSFLNKKKEIIESMLANVLNKIQECEFNKEFSQKKN